MKILISGAAGFLGRKFVEFYDNPENEILAIDNFQSPYAKEPELHNGWFYKEDIRSTIRFLEPKRKKKRFDLFIHLAAPVGGREKIDGDPLFNAESLAIDSDVFRWAPKNVETLVYPSSSAVYPISLQNGTHTAQLKELYVNPAFLDWEQPDQMYGMTKFVGEFLAQKAEAYGLRTICIRPFSGYGAGQSQEYPFPSLMRRIVLREEPFIIWGDGTQERDFIHVDDIVRLTSLVVGNSKIQGYFPINLGTGVPTSFNFLAQLAFGIEGWFPKDIQHLTDKPVGVHFRVSDTQNMKHHGLVPTVTLGEGIKEVLEYERRVAGRPDGVRQDDDSIGAG
jgi:UDP-glucose 4-epimerase